MRWFKALMPKEHSFFELFAKHSRTIVDGAEALQGMLRGGAEIEFYCDKINQYENEADNITREVMMAIRRSFITPFDRGDIKNLIAAMDDAIDQMQQTAKTVRLFEVKEFDQPMQEMGAIIQHCAELVVRGVGDLFEGQSAYFIGPLLGGIVAALLYEKLLMPRAIEPADHGAVQPVG